MKNIVNIFFILIITVNSLFGQSKKNIEHKVIKGETITQIAKKYNTTPAEIFKLNPDAQKGIGLNTILVIPNTKGVSKTKVSFASTVKKHEVKPKETLFSIAKQYNISTATIESVNPELKNNPLKPGQILIIPNKDIVVKSEPKKSIETENKKEDKKTIANQDKEKNIIHEVKAQETKYSIAKQYDVTIEQLEKLNPSIVQGLPIGYKLIIGPKKDSKNLNQEVPKKEIPVVENPKKEIPKIDPLTTYTIKPKETLYSLTNQFDISQEQLFELNPELKEGMKEGMTIKIPKKTIAVYVARKEYINLTKNFKVTTNKKIALLLPFNINKLDKDTVNSIKSRLKKDKFLNMTLDFYAGALIAIDSVKKMGMNLDVKIYDSNETKSTSNVTTLIEQHNLKTMDAIIGPFYQQNVEKTAELLSNVPIISPLSKDHTKSYPNLFQATPSSETVKNAIFDFMRIKNGNIIAVIDPKKNAAKQYIVENQQDVILAPFNENGTLDNENFKLLLSKDKINYVIMETERTNLILSLTSFLQNASKEYQIKLVVLQENEVLDYEEINISRLTKLNLHYPSITKPNTSEEAIVFENNFRKKNKILPNAFATKGFDVTFDVLMRLSQQDKTFIETITEQASQQIENKFYYLPNPEAGYSNKGVYILNYDNDLTIKEAKQ
jgi:LysM repeat protein